MTETGVGTTPPYGGALHHNISTVADQAAWLDARFTYLLGIAPGGANESDLALVSWYTKNDRTQAKSAGSNWNQWSDVCGSRWDSDPTKFVNNLVVTPAAGGSLTAATYYYVVTPVVSGVEQNHCPQVSAVATATNKTMGLSWTAFTGATAYRVFRTQNRDGPYNFLAQVTTTSYTDNGSVSANTSVHPPSSGSLHNGTPKGGNVAGTAARNFRNQPASVPT